jgi:hypothetical protein
VHPDVVNAIKYLAGITEEFPKQKDIKK